MKTTHTWPPTALRLRRGQWLEIPLAGGGAWQVVHGMLLIGPARVDGGAPWQIALPGDWLHLEALCGLPQDLGITALTPSLLRPVPAKQCLDPVALLQRMLRQYQRWAEQMLGLRTGPVEQRMGQLLRLAEQAYPLSATVEGQQALPTLRDMARLVDAAPETACRVLARLQPKHQPVAVEPRRTTRQPSSPAWAAA